MSEKIDYYSREEVSNSRLSLLNPEEGGSPRKFKAGFDPEKDKQYSLEMGKLLHLAVLEPEKFVVADASKPSDKICEIMDYVWKWVQNVNSGEDELGKIHNVDNPRLREMIFAGIIKYGYEPNLRNEYRVDRVIEKGGKAYLKHLMSQDGKICISAQDRKVLDGCIASLKSHRKAVELLFAEDDFSDWSAYNELEIYWEAEATWVEEERSPIRVRIPCKGKLDRMRVNTRTKVLQIIDPKTTSSPVHAFKGSFKHYRYYRQAFFYCQAAKEWLLQQGYYSRYGGGWRIEFYNIAVSTRSPHDVAVIKVLPEWIAKGQSEAESLLMRLAWHVYHNEWEYSREEVENDYCLSIPYED